MPCFQPHIGTVFCSPRCIHCCFPYFSAHRVNVICCRNQASKQAHNTAKAHYLTVCSVVQWPCSTAFHQGQSSDYGIYSACKALWAQGAKQEWHWCGNLQWSSRSLILKKSWHITAFFHGQRKMFMWVEEENRTGRLISLLLTFKKVKKFFN